MSIEREKKMRKLEDNIIATLEYPGDNKVDHKSNLMALRAIGLSILYLSINVENLTEQVKEIKKIYCDI